MLVASLSMLLSAHARAMDLTVTLTDNPLNAGKMEADGVSVYLIDNADEVTKVFKGTSPLTISVPDGTTHLNVAAAAYNAAGASPPTDVMYWVHPDYVETPLVFDIMVQPGTPIMINIIPAI